MGGGGGSGSGVPVKRETVTGVSEEAASALWARAAEVGMVLDLLKRFCQAIVFHFNFHCPALLSSVGSWGGYMKKLDTLSKLEHGLK